MSVQLFGNLNFSYVLLFEKKIVSGHLVKSSDNFWQNEEV